MAPAVLAVVVLAFLAGCQSAYVDARAECEHAGWDTHQCAYAQQAAAQGEQLREVRRGRVFRAGARMSRGY